MARAYQPYRSASSGSEASREQAVPPDTRQEVDAGISSGEVVGAEVEAVTKAADAQGPSLLAAVATVFVYNPNGAFVEQVTQMVPGLLQASSTTQVQKPGGGSGGRHSTTLTNVTPLQHATPPSRGTTR